MTKTSLMHCSEKGLDSACAVAIYNNVSIQIKTMKSVLIPCVK